MRNFELIHHCDATKRFSRLSATVITLFPVPPITCKQERKRKKRKWEIRRLHSTRNTLMKGCECETQSYIFETNVMYYLTHSFSFYIIYIVSLISSRRSLQHSTHCNMTDGEKENQKRNSGRKKPFSCSQLLPLGVGASICGCIAKMPLPCASHKKLGAHLSDSEIEYARITHVITME
jgi:hypothetical protein